MCNRWLWCLVFCVGCGGSSPAAPDAAGSGSGSGSDLVADAGLDAPTLPAPPTCPTTGSGALTPTDSSCFVFTPVDTGADPAGANATVNHYALAPTAGGNGHLVLFLNPSLGNPGQSIADPATNIYTAATAAGDHVLAIAYSSDDIIGALCKDKDGCFLPTRTTVVTGVFQTGAATQLQSIDVSTGIYARAALALRYLVAHDPNGGWAQYADATADLTAHPEQGVRWDKVFVMGHSQGGGHAALIAKLQSVARMIALSSPCDSIDTPAVPASWQTYDAATWASAPSAIGYGFGTQTTFSNTGAPTGGDTTCVVHAAVWDALGMVAANRFDDATQCAGASAHTATTQCTANMARVQRLVTP